MLTAVLAADGLFDTEGDAEYEDVVLTEPDRLVEPDRVADKEDEPEYV